MAAESKQFGLQSLRKDCVRPDCEIVEVAK